ncbi:MAG: barstar family protein [Sphingobium sp.]|nr:barstar family protein [Sphingobium sp.]
MRTIELDASNWRSFPDFYEALLAGLGAPDWHGRNLDALIDSMVYGGINTIERPFRIQVIGVATAGKDAVDELRNAIVALVEEGAECVISGDCASIEIGPAGKAD